MDLVMVHIKRFNSNKVELLSYEYINKFSYKYMKDVFNSFNGKGYSESASFIKYEIVKYNKDENISMYKTMCFFNKISNDNVNKWKLISSAFDKVEF